MQTLIGIYLFFSLLQTSLATSDAPPDDGPCRNTCGEIQVQFPFGTGSGCGHPDFAKYIKCTSGTLQFSTLTGVYTVSSIDYPSSTVVVTDPLMSTCSSMDNSGSFSFDQGSQFSIMPNNMFVLLGCSRTSPVFDPDVELCDTGSGSRVCEGLYSCKAVTGIGLVPGAPISTCCVYQSPMGIGSLGYALELPKLQCSSYTSIYDFGGDEGDPMKRKYGMMLHYNGSYYSESCKNCEDSGGQCGYAGLGESFTCICPNGRSNTINCFGRGYGWSGTSKHQAQTSTIIGVILGILVLWALLVT